MQKRKQIVYYQEVTKLVLILFIVTLSSCKKEKYRIVKEYYNTGEIFRETSFINKTEIKEGVYKEYYKNGTVKKMMNFKNNLVSDSSMLYYKSGNLKFKEIIKKDTIYSSYYYQDGTLSSRSKFINEIQPIKVGWEKKYNTQGSLTDSIEYLKLNEKAFLNQRIKFNNKGQINYDSSFFYNVKISKILNSDFYELNIKYTPLNEKANVFIILGDSINASFSNLNQVSLDTLPMINNTLKTNKLKDNKRKLTGFFYEYYPVVKEVKNDSVTVTIRDKKTYFNKIFFVTDTIKNGSVVK